MLVLICMIFVSAFVSATVTLDKTSGTISVDQGETGTIALTITNNNAYDFTNVKLNVVDINSFIDEGDNQIVISFSDSADTTGFALNSNQSKTIIISATPEEEQYLGELTGEILVTARRADGNNETVSFDLTVDTEADLVSITLDEGDLDDEVYSGDDVSFYIEVENNAGYDMEDVQVKVWIVDIEDNDDIDMESKKFDLDNTDSEEVDFDFTIPYNVDEDKFDIKVRVKGQDADNSDRDFEVVKTFRGIVDVAKEEDEEIYLEEPSLSVDSFTCGTSFSVSVNAINTGTDDLDDAYLKLTVEGTDISVKSQEFDLDSDKYDDREQDVDFLVKLPDKLDSDSYEIRIVAYTEDDSTVGTVYKTISVKTCDKTVEEEEEEVKDQTADNEGKDSTDKDNTVYLPTGWTTKFFSSETGKTIFWFMGNLALLVIIIYFISVLARKKTIKK